MLFDFIVAQFALYKAGTKSIGIEKIKQLAVSFMTKEQIFEVFGDEVTFDAL